MTAAAQLESCCWPVSRLGEALALVARIISLPSATGNARVASAAIATHNGENLEQWIDAAAASLGLEAQPAEARYSEIERLIRDSGPALFRVPGKKEAHFLVLVKSSKRRVSLLGLDHIVHALRPEIVRAALCQEMETPVTSEVDQLLDAIGTSDRRRDRARNAILREQLSALPISACWLLRLAPGGDFWSHAEQAKLPGRLVALVAAHTAQYLLWLLAWWILGQAVLQGRFDPGWLGAWALLLFCLVPFRLFVIWSQGLLAIGAGALLKQRLLYGALRLEPDEIRHQGVGQLLGRVIESEAVESLALSGGFLGLVAGIELLVAAFVVGAGSGGWLHSMFLLGWVFITLFMGWSYYKRREQWTDVRLGMTNDLVERMVGHRTRLAQEPRDHWHDGEDQSMHRYLDQSAAMDRSTALLMALGPRGWVVIGLLGLVPAFVSVGGSPVGLAVSIGGILLAYRALQKLAQGLSHLVGAGIAWKQIAPLFQAAARSEHRGSPDSVDAPGSSPGQRAKAATVVEAHDLAFRYHDRGEAVLRGCNLRICAGDRLLLEGPSGGGKSTLASLLMGLRQPSSGLLLLHGLDWQTAGNAIWRQHVAAAPQFHENHVLTATFAFNLLMGRRWPPQVEDLQRAGELCVELGLGDLLGRMPAGLLQMVGETGWQLSHGEKSRLYLARALLGGADLIVLDESFASLDPENLRRALRCVLERAPTLLVIAHP